MTSLRNPSPVILMAAFIAGVFAQGVLDLMEARRVEVVISKPITAHVDFSSDERLEALK